MEVKFFFRFAVIMYLLTEGHYCYAGKSRFLNSMEKSEVLNHLNLLNKHPVKSIKSPDGDIIDCVHISHQPAFDHPLLKNHTIKMRPNYHPNWVKDDNMNMNASKVGLLKSSSDEEIAQLWHSNGKCPKGTIPIIRTKKEDVLRADSIKSYGKKKKKSIPVVQQSSIDPPLTDVRKGHEYAHANTDQGNFYGAQASFNIWNPKVQENNEFSLGQLWILGGPDSYLNTIEAGWHVFPELNGDMNTRLFIYWTNDGYQKTGCYNLKCSGFIQTNNNIAIGGSISPTSLVDGTQYEIAILIWKDIKEGDWWMQYNGKTIGYWPASLFSYLSVSASVIDFGGEIVNLASDGHHTTTQMGSGHFPSEGFEKASYIRNILTVDGSNTLTTPGNLNAYVSRKSCYDIVTGVADNNWGTYFFYGGPGRNQNCP